MKSTKTLITLVAALCVAAGLAFAAETKEAQKAPPPGKVAACCAKAAKEGHACTHGDCCVAAAKAGKNCEKCGGTNEAPKK